MLKDIINKYLHSNKKIEAECTNFHFDLPVAFPTEEKFDIQGWVASNDKISKAWLPADTNIELPLVPRPDVLNVYPYFPYVLGFSGKGHRGVLQNDEIVFNFQIGEKVTSHSLSFMNSERKNKKLSRISPYLMCPKCKSDYDPSKSQCPNCHETYVHYENSFNFLTADLRKKFAIVDSGNVSSHGYDIVAHSIIQKYKDGLILDCGAGKRDFFFPNVINYEIVNYPSTDVLGVGETLPFRDETFDAVFSLAVLEHVKDPFVCASEIIRVLKKGGMVFCVVPFLQPFHAYPNHFYNMSSQGLQNLFDKSINITRCEVPFSGLPIWTLSWILRNWAEGLDNETREQFLQMKVGELIGNPMEYLQMDFVKNLPEKKNFELACTTLIVGDKK